MRPGRVIFAWQKSQLHTLVFLFRDKSIAAIFFLAVLCIVAHLHFFLQPPQVVISDDDGLFSILFGRYLAPLPVPALLLLYYGLVLLQATRFNLLLNELRMFPQTGFITAMIYTLLSAFIPQWCAITPALVANSFVIWIFINLSRMNNHPAPKTLLFNTGLLTGVAILCYHPASILIPAVLLALMIIRAARITEWLVLLIGIIVPYYLLFSILFLTGYLREWQRFMPECRWNLPVNHPDIFLWVRLGLLSLLLLIGVAYWLGNRGRMLMHIRKNWGVLLLMLVMLLPVPFIYKNAGLPSAFLAVVPLSGFIANFFIYPRNKMLSNFFFLLLLAVVIHTNWLIVQKLATP